MPLKPDVAGVLDLINSFDGPPVETLSPEEARAAYAALYPPEPKEPVAEVADHVVDTPDGPLPVRSYRPAGSSRDERLGALLWFHGGGFVIGDLDTADADCRALANRSGAAVVSVGYRLAPEHPYPAAVDDAANALTWMHDNPGVVGIDPGRIAVGGDSAGGNIAAVLCQLSKAARGPAIRFQLLVYPTTDLTLSFPSITENGEGYFLTAGLMRWFSDCYVAGRDASNPRVSPLRCSDLSGLPPALVITAEFDPLRDEGQAYAAALREAGVDAELRHYEGQIHGFFSMDRAVADGDEAKTVAADALRAALAG